MKQASIFLSFPNVGFLFTLYLDHTFICSDKWQIEVFGSFYVISLTLWTLSEIHIDGYRLPLFLSFYTSCFTKYLTAGEATPHGANHSTTFFKHTLFTRCTWHVNFTFSFLAREWNLPVSLFKLGFRNLHVLLYCSRRTTWLIPWNMSPLRRRITR